MSKRSIHNWVRGLWLFLGLLLQPVSHLALASESARIPTPATPYHSGCEQQLSDDGILAIDPNAYPGSYRYYALRAEQRRGPYADKHLTFRDFQRDAQISTTWTGEQAPALLQAILPDGVSYVDHELRQNEGPGIVKVMKPKGEFLILRAHMPVGNEVFSTNVVATASAVAYNLDNLIEELNNPNLPKERWLVGPVGFNGVVDWKHGGGTRGTGAATVDTTMDAVAKDFKFAATAVDQPLHAEGDQHLFPLPDQLLAVQAEFMKRYIHPRVPRIMNGHSLGGEMVDMANRRSGEAHAHLGIREQYDAFIAQAAVADLKPGGTYEEKSVLERVKARQQKEALERANAIDHDMFERLLKANKMNPKGGLLCEIFNLGNDWSPPANGGRDLHKMLHIIGEYDFLFVLNEQLYNDCVRSLPNAELLTMGVRVTFRGDIEAVGHLPHDYLVPVKSSPEAESVMRDYLTHLGVPGEEIATVDQLSQVFRRRVLAEHIWEGSFAPRPNGEPAYNSYPSAMVLAAYHHVPEFHDRLEARISQAYQARPANAAGDLDTFRRQYFLGYAEAGKFESVLYVREFLKNFVTGGDLKTDAEKQERQNFLNRRPMTEAQAQRLAMKLSATEKVISDGDKAAFIKFLKLWGNVLAFREFIYDYTHGEAKGLPKFVALNQTREYYFRRDKIMADQKKPLSEREAEVVRLKKPETLLERTPETLAYLNQLDALRQKEFIPEGENKEWATANVNERKALRVQLESLAKGLDTSRETLKEKEDAKSKIVRKLDEAIAHAVETSPTAAIREATAAKDAAFDQLLAADNAAVIASSQIGAAVSRGELTIGRGFANAPQEWQELSAKSANLSEIHTQLAKKLDETIVSEARAGHLGSEIGQMSNEVYGPSAMNLEIQALQKKVALEEFNLREMKKREQQLLKDYCNRVVPEYFVYTETRMWDLLEDPKRWKDAINLMQRAFADWGVIWSDRPTATVDFY